MASGPTGAVQMLPLLLSKRQGMGLQYCGASRMLSAQLSLPVCRPRQLPLMLLCGMRVMVPAAAMTGSAAGACGLEHWALDAGRKPTVDGGGPHAKEVPQIVHD